MEDLGIELTPNRLPKPVRIAILWQVDKYFSFGSVAFGEFSRDGIGILFYFGFSREEKKQRGQ